MPFADPEKAREYQRQYRLGRRSQQRAYNAAYRIERAEAIRAHDRLRYQQARSADPDAVRERARRQHLKRNYGVTPEQIAELRAAQGSRCAICERRLRELHVDHDHLTGAIRGLLCGSCNRAIGLLRDDPKLVARAAAYLRVGLMVFVQ